MILCHNLAPDIYQSDGGSLDTDVNTDDTGFDLINGFYSFILRTL